MDTDIIKSELRSLINEENVLRARLNNILSRRCDIPLPDLASRLSAIEDRRTEVEPLAIEFNMLSAEVESLKTAISARSESQADIARTERRIESLALRRQIILDLAASSGISLEFDSE